MRDSFEGEAMDNGHSHATKFKASKEKSIGLIAPLSTAHMLKQHNRGAISNDEEALAKALRIKRHH